MTAALLAACSAYDASLIEPGRRGSPSGRGAQGQTGGRGGSGGMASAGSGGRAGTSAAGAGGTGGTSTATPDGGNDPDLPVAPCGDGRVAGGETCDSAIAAGQPGACPTECPRNEECQPRELQGTGCQAQCVDVALDCTSGDGCCPPDCSNPEDDDCSASCGDGTVQPDAGETCEVPAPDIEVAPGEACPTDCPDDGDECTVEALTGSAANCNARCTTTDIVDVDDDDDCCPDNGNNNVDDDCPVVCGNDAVEAGEDCDGGPDCDDQCNSTIVTEPQRCMNVFTDASMGCRDCMCMECTSAVNNCFDSGNDQRDEDCAELVACGLEHGCRGAQCYCGLGTDPNGTCVIGDGPCAALMDQIAATPGALSVYNESRDPNTALGRARAFTDCHGAECPSACPPP